MNVLAIIPARAGSRGIKNKNFKPLASGDSPLERAIQCAAKAGVHLRVVSTDCWPLPFPSLRIELNEPSLNDRLGEQPRDNCSQTLYINRPAELAQDDTPMIDVVKHALEQIPGPDDQIVLLAQPTQPLRKPAHLTAAIEALVPDWDSVVSITPIPRTHAPDFVLMYSDTTLSVGPWRLDKGWDSIPTRRQSVPWPYVRDGSVYAFRRSTVARFGNIYGEYVRGLIIDPSETCPLDTPEDWAEAERRLRG